MNKVSPKVRGIISDFVWNATVGSGDDRQPTAEDVVRLEAKLGGPLTTDEAALFRSRWQEELQCMAHP